MLTLWYNQRTWKKPAALWTISVQTQRFPRNHDNECNAVNSFGDFGLEPLWVSEESQFERMWNSNIHVDLVLQLSSENFRHSFLERSSLTTCCTFPSSAFQMYHVPKKVSSTDHYQLSGCTPRIFPPNCEVRKYNKNDQKHLISWNFLVVTRTGYTQLEWWIAIYGIVYSSVH